MFRVKIKTDSSSPTQGGSTMRKSGSRTLTKRTPEAVENIYDKKEKFLDNYITNQKNHPVKGEQIGRSMRYSMLRPYTSVIRPRSPKDHY